MKVVKSLKKEKINNKVKVTVENGSSVVYDKFTSYVDLSYYYEYDSKVTPKNKIPKIFPWVQDSLRNANRMLLNMHHRIDDNFLQNY